MLNDIISARISELKTMFLATGKINHRGEKGSLREAFVINLLQQFLPEHFGLGSGIVIDKGGNQSVQVDIIVYDKRIAPPIIEAAGRGVYLIDSVLRVIEVKSVITSESCEQFSRMIDCFTPKIGSLRISSKGKLNNNECFYPVCAMFGFDSNISDLGRVCAKYESIVNSESLIYINSGKLWNYQKITLDNFDLEYQGRSQEFDNDEDGLKLFIGLLFNGIEATAKSRSDYRPMDWLM